MDNPDGPRDLFLLGAGASFEAGVPLANGMTREIAGRFSDQPWSDFG